MNEIKIISYNKKCEDEIISLIEMIYPKIKTREKDSDYRKLAIQKCLRNLNLSVFTHCIATLQMNISGYHFDQLFSNNDLSFSHTIQEAQNLSYDIPSRALNNKYEAMYTGLIKKIEQLKKECSFDSEFFIPKCALLNIIISGNFLSWFKFLKRYHEHFTDNDMKMLVSEIYKKLNDICPLLFNELNFKLRI